MRKFTLLVALCLSMLAFAACSSKDDKPKNAAPVAGADFAATVLDSAIVIDVLRGDVDPNGDTITVVDAVVSNPALGAVTIAGDGLSITFTPALGANGMLTITYTIQDSKGAQAMGTVTLVIANSATLSVVSGDNQSGISGETLDPMVVEVRDDQNNPLRGAYVSFAVTTGDGTLSTTVTQITDEMGRVSSTLTLGSAGAHVIDASMIGATNTPLQLSATSAAALSLTTTALGNAETGTMYVDPGLMASGGFPPYTYTRTGGDAMPLGLTNNMDGTITGTPAAGTDGSYSFVMQVTDNDGNMASGNVTLNITDGIDPEAPTGLAAAYSGTVNTVNLTFTTSGDDGATGTASSFQIRTSTNDITNSTDFDGASVVANSATPLASGSMQTVQVPLTWYNGVHYFAIRAVDDAGNVSPVSTSVMVDTDATGSFPAAPHDFGAVSIGGTATQNFMV
ncbi:MAG: cadherin-like domain-containing protein, partial [Planctomycetes bacterium]|nr:cadherin-like domain-containing protein [Planctomycetota bacterium]